MRLARRRQTRWCTVWVVVAAILSVLMRPAAAQNNDCDELGETPDVIVGDLHEEHRWGSLGQFTAFSIGTISCNVGTCWLNWIAITNEHPVISQGIYRLKEGRFEQLGQSWLKHSFLASSGQVCSDDCIPTVGSHLGVNCSDPYSATRNGIQNSMGPKFEVNPVTGEFPYPATDLYLTGDAIFKRIQVLSADLDPALNPGAQYFIEGHYITADDAMAGNQNNNASYRPIVVFQNGTALDFDVTGTTHREQPAIQAWQDQDPLVELDFIDVADDGRFIAGARATELGGGMWHYEYALTNLNSHRSARSFSLSIMGPGVDSLENLGFHDVRYHSGEPWDTVDWLPTIDSSGEPSILTWSTSTFAEDPEANALRWGTIYNFRFDVNIPPAQGEITVELFRPGSPASFTIQTVVPGFCNENGSCEIGEDECDCPTDCVPTSFEAACFDSLDNDCDGRLDCADTEDCCGEAACQIINADGDPFGLCEDCNDSDGTAWSTPGEALDAYWNVPATGEGNLRWSAPVDLGGTTVGFDVLRSGDPSDFISDPDCFPTPTRRYVELAVPASGSVYSYLIRATNGCIGDQATGPLGDDSDGTPREGTVCP